MSRHLCTITSLCLALLLQHHTASGQSFPPMTGGDYRFDLHQGPVLGSTRVIGMGGAYAAVAEGTEGIPFNPAAVVNRPYFSTEHFDWSWAFDFLIPNGSGGDFDFDNNGRSASGGVWPVLVLGAHLQYGNLAAGAYVSVGTTTIETEGQDFDAKMLRGHLSVGAALFNHQLLVAGGVGLGTFSISHTGKQDDLFVTGTSALEAGLLWRPRALPLRVGISGQLPLGEKVEVECADACPKGIFLPKAPELPWQLRIGVSYRFGDGQYNPTPDFVTAATKAIRPASNPASKPASIPASAPHRIPGQVAARPESRPTSLATSHPASIPSSKPTAEPDLDQTYRGGRYLLISAEVVAVGPSSQATGPDGFLAQQLEPVGETVTLVPHLGVEAEILSRRLRLRAGTYYETSRYAGTHGRIHGTASVLLRLFDFSLWGRRALAFAPGVDVAARYLNVSFFLAFWH